jgi:RNA polymerase subunit RPABC4/transcription elongation factor Spt4
LSKWSSVKYGKEYICLKCGYIISEEKESCPKCGGVMCARIVREW